ncbi:hypothetical protein NHG85_11645, partial [Limimaricola sp. ASW11-118]|nr:hypothetical protein [Limimaricola litoreus]
PARLFGTYTARTPAASGGIWDRAAAVQTFDTALRAQDARAVAEALPSAWTAMHAARLQAAFAQHYATDLSTLDLPDTVAGIALEVALLGPDYEAVPLEPGAAVENAGLAAALARGLDEPPFGPPPEEPMALALLDGFSDRAPPESLARMIKEDRLGEVILRATLLIDQGRGGDTGALTEGLAALRAVGMEEVARRIALQVLLLDSPA